MPVQRQASCACGRLRATLFGDPQLVLSCHCLACQRRTGALFGSTSFWKKSQVVSTEGERRAFPRRADSGTVLTFQFCPNCGSTVFWESGKTPDMISVAVGSFGDPTFPMPERTVWTETRHEWLAFPPSIPHFQKSSQKT